jgi:hypothetical protein
MSYRAHKNMSLAGVDYSGIAEEELVSLFNKHLNNILTNSIEYIESEKNNYQN